MSVGEPIRWRIRASPNAPIVERPFPAAQDDRVQCRSLSALRAIVTGSRPAQKAFEEGHDAGRRFLHRIVTGVGKRDDGEVLTQRPEECCYCSTAHQVPIVLTGD